MTPSEALLRRDNLLRYLAATHPVHDRTELARLTTQVIEAAARHLDAKFAGTIRLQDLPALAAMSFLLLKQHSDRRGDLTWNEADRKLERILIAVTETFFNAISEADHALHGTALVARWFGTFSEVKLATLQRLGALHDFVATQLVERIGELKVEIANIEGRRAAAAAPTVQ